MRAAWVVHTMDLDVDLLIPLMPIEVREEYFTHGDASIFGFSPGVEHWLKHSQHPRVVKWREELKRETVRNIEQALIEQQKMADLAQEAYGNATRGSIRIRAVIHPLIKGWMEHAHPGAWNDPAAIADTERRHPRLFVNQQRKHY